MIKYLQLTVLCSVFAISLSGQSFNEVLKIVASDRANAYSFGFSVSMDGDYAVVGSFNAGTANSPVNKQGAAYILKKDNNDNWQEVKKIIASDGFDDDNFGYSVNISGDYVIVGAYNEDEDVNGMNTLDRAGAAYIFHRNEGGTDNWGEVKKLVASDRGQDDTFGRGVSISGGYAVVGANYNQYDVNGMNAEFHAGAVYIFEKDNGGTDNWGEVKKLVPSDRDESDDFGRNVIIQGDVLVVTASGQKMDALGGNPLNWAGAVYIFERNEGGTNNWGELQKIVAADRTTGAGFGSSIALDGDYMAVGASYATSDTAATIASGAAYVFKKDVINGINSWSEFKKIVSSDAAVNDLFGYDIDISGDNVIVGAWQEEEDLTGSNPFNKAGSAYIFNRNEGGLENWGETQKIVSSDRSANDRFAFCVAIEGDWAMVPSFLESLDATGGNDLSGAGAVYVFKYGIASSSKDIIDNSALKIFPNPVQNTLFIESETTFQMATIYNVLGQPVQQISIQNHQAEINVSNLPEGVYLLQLMMENGESVTKQIIKN